MIRSSWLKSWWPIAILIAVSAAITVVALWPQSQSTTALPIPTRVAVVDETVPPTPDATDIPGEVPLEVLASDILNVSIPAVGLDVRVSGETWPRASPRCKGGTTKCIDPSLVDQAAWYGTLPSTESTGTVRLFGHTDATGAPAAFNALVAVKAGDRVVVETETGVFTYQAVDPQLVPYDRVIESELIWEEIPDRLILVTCNNQASSGTVIEAWLVTVEIR